jgi:hypothetical protein
MRVFHLLEIRLSGNPAIRHITRAPQRFVPYA